MLIGLSRALMSTLAALMVAASASEARARQPSGTITLDGQFADWPGPEIQACADGHYVYLRLNSPEQVTLQAAPVTYEVLLDLDGVPPPNTSGVDPGAAPHERGWDMAIQFSPPASEDSKGKRPSGVQIFALDASGRRTRVPADAIDLAFAPTFAASSFEVRISRHLEGLKGLPPNALAAEAMTWKGVTLDQAGHVAREGSVAACRLPARAPTKPLADVDVPPPTEGALRIVSWNVLKASPMSDPDKFARMLTVLAPDVVLVQEWEGTTPAQLEGWFNQHVPGDKPWHALMSDGWGVGVVSRLPLERLGPQHIDRPKESAPDRNRPDTAVRFAGAAVLTPIGNVGVASIHLKCCGSKDSKEDIARLAEARAINSAFAAGAAERKTPVRFIAGDFNLVGSEPPLAQIRSGLDSDGTELAIAPARVLGDDSFFTWTDAASPFTPGRLDYAVYSDASAEVVRAFVVDTARLSDESLSRAGVRREDSRASDHMPVVVDLRLKK